MNYIKSFFNKHIKALFPQTLWGRTLIIIIAPTIILQIILTLYFYEKHWETISKRLSDYLAGDISYILVEIRDASPKKREEILRSSGQLLDLKLSFRENEILPVHNTKRGNTRLERILQHSLSGRIGYPFIIDAWSFKKESEIKIQLETGVLRLLVKRKKLFSSTTYVFMLWMIGSSILLLTVSIIFMRNQIKPIRILGRVVERFGRGENVSKLKPSGAIEVRQAAKAFNSMRSRIQRQVKQRTEMLAGVSHDLRTPLTRMSLQLAMMPDTEEVEELKSDVVEMQDMLEEYLAFARGEGSEPAVRVDISLMLKDIIENAQRENCQISAQIDNDIQRILKPTSFKRCIHNLISNASKYGQTINLTAKRKGNDSFYIIIDDDGPGIKKEDRKKVFKPFYRLEASRNKKTGGVGLGLTIARDVINAHGGEIYLEKSPLGGLRVLIKLPF